MPEDIARPVSAPPVSARPESARPVYQLIDDELYTCGLFDTFASAFRGACALKQQHPSRRYQSNRIPMNTLGNYGRIFDVAMAMR